MRASKNGGVRHNTVRHRWGLASGGLGLIVLFSGFLVINALRPLGSEALAQQHIHSSHEIDQTVAPLVDGSEQPELIPDDVAIRAFMQTIRVPLDPDTAALKRLNAQVDRIDLSHADMQILVHELGILDARAQEQEARVEAALPSPAADRSAIAHYRGEQAKLRLLMEEHYQQLLGSLSPGGAVKLQEHLWYVKSRIKIYPRPNMFLEIN